MAHLDGWDWGLLALGGYIAVVALVRLMIGHREQTLARMRQEVEAEQRRQQAAAKAAAAAGAAAPERRARAA